MKWGVFRFLFGGGAVKPDPSEIAKAKGDVRSERAKAEAITRLSERSAQRAQEVSDRAEKVALRKRK
jgi:hypothetical protein